MSWKFDRSKSLAGKKFNPLSLLNPIWSNSPKPQNWLYVVVRYSLENTILYFHFRNIEWANLRITFCYLIWSWKCWPTTRWNASTWTKPYDTPFSTIFRLNIDLNFDELESTRNTTMMIILFFFIQHGILKQKENRNKLLPTFHFFFLSLFLKKETVH